MENMVNMSEVIARTNQKVEELSTKYQEQLKAAEVTCNEMKEASKILAVHETTAKELAKAKLALDVLSAFSNNSDVVVEEDEAEYKRRLEQSLNELDSAKELYGTVHDTAKLDIEEVLEFINKVQERGHDVLEGISHDEKAVVSPVDVDSMEPIMANVDVASNSMNEDEVISSDDEFNFEDLLKEAQVSTSLEDESNEEVTDFSKLFADDMLSSQPVEPVVSSNEMNEEVNANVDIDNPFKFDNEVVSIEKPNYEISSNNFGDLSQPLSDDIKDTRPNALKVVDSKLVSLSTGEEVGRSRSLAA